jgi:hypothetical protein
MNDFTREELIHLISGLDLIEMKCSMSAEIKIKISALQDKLYEMIEKFCKHNNSKQCNISEQIVCLDCGEELHE